ncbi:MAG: hypothetical protein B7Y84_15780 [Azorhizobium sp. 32-67-21]|nr:MAG: hypothetical protein B7Y84_15780 [Azorhizobium sp. 32-67-21]
MSTATLSAPRVPAPLRSPAPSPGALRQTSPRRDIPYAYRQVPAAPPAIPRLKLKLLGALMGISGIAAAALQTAGYLPRPGEWFSVALEEADTGIEMVLERPAPVAAPAPASLPAPAPMVTAEAKTELEAQPAAAPARPLEITSFRAAGSLSNGPSWAFEPSVAFAPFTLAETDHDTPEATVAPERQASVRLVPLPKANPLAGLAPEDEALPPVVVRPPTPPARSPLLRVERQMASLPAEEPVTREERAPRGSAVTLPGPADRYAVYDITARTVYLPSGERLEAHSGYGAMFDDPRHVSKKMRGPTPPNVYNLRMREALFHGVEAIRMLPVDSGKMYGRDGILAHSYMLGPRGDSNGCVSFRDYPRFLAAFKRGEVKQMIVVAKLENQPITNPLLSWLSPR